MVAINAVIGDNGLINQAEQAKDLSANSTESDLEGMNKVYAEYANVMAEDIEIPVEPPVPSTVEEAKERGDTFEDTTIIKDDLDNNVTIPGGFHVAEDSGTKVEEGIVIEDELGNQFVWIPVGSYNTTKGEKTNNLSRRIFTETNSTEVDENEIIQEDGREYYGEENENSIAYDQIGTFKEKSIASGGFYIGRFEAGTDSERGEADDFTIPLVQKNKYTYDYITRDEAKEQAELLYENNNFVTSELISSYAWDTTLNFICQNNDEGYLLAMSTSNEYGNIGTGKLELTGNYQNDKYCNIFDFLGNIIEYTTEHYIVESRPAVLRGAYFNGQSYAANRGNGPNDRDNYVGFRIQLYIK